MLVRIKNFPDDALQKNKSKHFHLAYTDLWYVIHRELELRQE